MEKKINRCVLCGAVMQGAGRQRCAICGLVQVVPMKSVLVEHFAPYIEQIDVHRKYFQKKLQEINRRGTLLDIGCAMGVLLEEAKKTGYRVQGTDISKKAVDYCRKKGLHVSQDWPKTLFDVITAFEVIEHEQDPVGMMRRVYKLLKNDGIVVLTTPNHSGIWRKIMGKWWVGYRHPEHLTFWSPGSLRYLMEKERFTKIIIRKDTPRPFPLSFLFIRAADYFPWAAWFLKPIGTFAEKFDMINPVNPWDDLIVYAVK